MSIGEDERGLPGDFSFCGAAVAASLWRRRGGSGREIAVAGSTTRRAGGARNSSHALRGQGKIGASRDSIKG